ncbi:Pre-mRNA-processing protein PRP40 [Ostreococcus tauri]|uniref:Pre-mRNA-processing protein PRP40 n=1 Tax=Ostreococcus tauri TaxID=70448 RepID=Q01BP3_OSTTA|nr:Pre-mRNA-processing protein PRP40 [Ostreococcus tauri]CAL51403.1 Pre-mRNA-processing protein PRP40 [Ostreococcus tauri]|eukprot:XP_003078523.1 Pre-mRNA-processing protein PRP40 [Ostreococcus tauri]
MRAHGIALFVFVVFTSTLSTTVQSAKQVFFYNDVTGESRWDDPDGLTTYSDDEGKEFWVDPNTGESTYEPRTKWSSHDSEDTGVKYFYNEETKESTWDRPEELAWRRIEQDDDDNDSL